MDLFYAHLTEEEPGPWNEIENGLPNIDSKGCKVIVKLSDMSETFAYFYPDKASWGAQYGIKPAFFWSCITREPLFNVTHWKKLKE